MRPWKRNYSDPFHETGAGAAHRRAARGKAGRIPRRRSTGHACEVRHGAFTDVTEKAGVASQLWSALYVTNYVDFSINNNNTALLRRRGRR